MFFVFFCFVLFFYTVDGRGANQVSGTVWEVLGVWHGWAGGLVGGGMSLGVAFEVSKAQARHTTHLSLLVDFIRMQALSYHSRCHDCRLPAVMTID